MRRIGVDIGGTFTDIVYLDDDQMDMVVEKVLSTPADLSRGVLEAIRKIDVDISKVELVVHGTTAGMNAVIQKTGARVGLLVTREAAVKSGPNSGEPAGCLAIRDNALDSFVPDKLCVAINEKIDPSGTLVQAVERAELQAILKTFRDNGAEAIAVCLQNSVVNPANEVDVERIIRETWPGIPVSLSHRTACGFEAGDRVATTVLNAYITPVLSGYLNKVGEEFAALHFDGRLRIVGAGGVQGADLIKEQGIVTFAARSFGGLNAAVEVAESLELADVAVMDAGGTSIDVCVIKNRVPCEQKQVEWAGHRIMLPLHAGIRSIGAGGGSIARLDMDGRLTVGVESAGADPGPICYGRGGTEPTVTDAALVNNLLDPDCFMGGEMGLDKELAFEGVRKLADRMGLSVHDAAEAILNEACDVAAAATRELLDGQGSDPRSFSLIASGGAGGLFAASLIRTLAMQKLVIPPHCGVYSAYGMLTMDVVHHLTRPYAGTLQSADLGGLAGLLDVMQREGRSLLAKEGVAEDAMHFIPALEMSCDGMDGCVTIAMPAGALNENSRSWLAAGFAGQCQSVFGRCREAEPQITAVNLKAVGRVEEVPYKPSPPFSVNIPPDAFKGSRMVYHGGQYQEWAVLDRAYLLPANSVIGPLIVDERHHTTVVLPGQRFMVDAKSNLIIQNPG